MLDQPPQNKMMKAAPNKKTLREFFFSGSGSFHPMTILADTIEEAEALFFKQRKPISLEIKESQALSTPPQTQEGQEVQ